MRELREFYIGGRWISANSSAEHVMIDPSSEQATGVISLAGRLDVDAAVAAASAAFPAWSVTDPGERIALVERIHEVYARRCEEMALAISAEMGAPIELARTRQAPAALGHMKNFLAAMTEIEFVHPLGPHAPDDRILLEPIGVVGLITPWNWPMSQVTLKVIPAMLAGCTMVLKPSEYAPLSSALLAEIIDEAGAPPGVFNLVQGDGATGGSRLVEHPDVTMVSFTGSTGAGARVLKGAADTFKRVALELGGKGANLVFSDADEDAVERGVRACFINSGQNCNAPTRMLVERQVYEQAIERARQVAETITVGMPQDEGPHVGPVVNGQQHQRIQSLIEKGMDEGARLVAGGPGRPAGFDRGYFTQPTVFADVTNEMTIAREEIFGPVLAVIPFDNEEHALQIANDTLYGLTNYVQSNDAERRKRVARGLRSGMVEMNGQPRGAGSPFGGIRHSGGGREGGKWGIEEYLIVKSVSGW